MTAGLVDLLTSYCLQETSGKEEKKVKLIRCWITAKASSLKYPNSFSLMHKLSYLLVYADKINTTWPSIHSFSFYKLFKYLFFELTNIPAAYWSENKESIEKLES